jgi:hypothetical protein
MVQIWTGLVTERERPCTARQKSCKSTPHGPNGGREVAADLKLSEEQLNVPGGAAAGDFLFRYVRAD